MASSIQTNVLKRKSDISKEWIQNILSKYFNKTTQVDSFIIDDGSSSNGFLSEFLFIAVRTDSNLCRLAIKLFPTNSDMSNLLVDGKFHATESLFIDAFLKIQHSRSVALPIPIIYFNGYEDEAFTLVMNNLCAEGYKTCVEAEGIGTEITLVAFKAIAKLHACGFMYLNGCSNEDYRKLKRNKNGETVLENILRNLIKTGLEIVCDPKDNILPLDSEILSILKTFLHNEDFSKFFIDHQTTIPETLVHGDYWSGQIMYNETEDKVCVIDWQFANIACLTLDLTTFLLMSCKREVYANDLSLLLSAYFQEFKQCLQNFEIEIPISMQDLKDNMENSWILGLRILISSIDGFYLNGKISKKRIADILEFCHSKNCF